MRSENPELQTNFLPLLITGGHHSIGFHPRLSSKSSTESQRVQRLYISYTKPPLLVFLSLRKILHGGELLIPFWILPSKTACKLNFPVTVLMIYD